MYTPLRSSRALKLAVIALIAFLLSSSCRKTMPPTGNEHIVFSTDTLLFDTVFTAQGSSTRSLRIFNPQKEKINLSSIRLAKGEQSPYRLNVNGVAGKAFEQVEIAGNDSLWVFAAVTIGPTDEDNPFLIEDELVVSLNGRSFSIPVIAFGQNAYYIVDSVLTTQTWKKDKPYIILHNALVDKGHTLTIPAGVRVYVHQDSRLYVQGTLKILGTADEQVIFQGDRIDRDIYVGPGGGDVPGEWGGLYFFKESYDNEIHHAIFKNGGASTSILGSQVMAATIQVDQDTVRIPNKFKLVIKNSTIHTSQGYGILAFNSSVYAENCLIAECGAENIMFFEGGNYELNYCTIVTYGSAFLRHDKHVALGILNYFPISQSEYTGADLKARLRNCIIFGSLENEAVIARKTDFSAQVDLEHCLIRNKDGIEQFVGLQEVIVNKSPEFIDQPEMDFHLEASSPAIGKGVSISGITTDMEGKNRASPPTIGCFEF